MSHAHPSQSAGADRARQSPAPLIVSSREVARLHAESQLRRAHERGTLHRLARGAYIDAAQWEALSPDERYRARVRAATILAGEDRQLSHDSAAALLHLPTIGPWPNAIHVTSHVRKGGVSRAGIQWHGIGMDAAAIDLDGVPVTSLARTVVDMACTTTMVRAVAMADDALRPPRPGDPRWGWGLVVPTRDELEAQIDARAPLRGSRRGAATIRFADGKSGSPSESVFRVQFHALGYPPPVLQHRVFDSAGFVGDLDFWFPQFGLGVEIDGLAKYSDGRRYQRDLDAWEIFKLEKSRENRMRDALHRFTRLDASIALDRRAIAVHLKPFGLIPSRG